MAMKRFSHSSILRFVRGFTLVEVILGSMVMAGFVGGTLFMAGQIGEARVGGLAQRDRNAWGNLQSQLAAEGIDASDTNAQIWGGKSFDGLLDGSLVIGSSSGNLDQVDMGEGLTVSPFRIDLSALGQRSNMNTVGFVLMDRTTAGGVPNLNKPNTNPFDLDARFQLVYYNKATGEYTFSGDIGDGGNAALDAWTQLNWNDPNGPTIYIIAQPSGAALSSIHISTSGSASSASPTLGSLAGLPTGVTFPDGWTFGGALDSSSLLVGNVLNVSYLVDTGDAVGVTRSFSITVTKVDPVVKAEVVNADGTARDTNAVTLPDAIPSVLSILTPADRLAMNSGYLRVSLYGSTDISDDEKFPTTLDAYLAITSSIGAHIVGTSTGSASTAYVYNVPAGSFGSTAATAWNVQVTSTNPFVNSIAEASTLTPVPTYLPEIVASPSGSPYVFYEPYILVTLAPDEELGLQGVAESLLYDIRYTDNGDAVNQASKQYTVPLEIGRSLTYLTSATVRAKAFSRYTSLGVFLQERESPLVASYKKIPDPDNPGDYWDYGSYGDNGAVTDTVTRQKWSDTVHIATPSIASSWRSGVVPNEKDRNVFFASVRPDNGQVTVDGRYTIGGLFFDNDDASFSLIKPSSGSSQINFRRDKEDNVELTVATGNNHIVIPPLLINQPIVINTDAASSKVTINEISKSAASSHGVYKQGSGTLLLNASPTVSNPLNSTTNAQHQIRYVVEKGTLQLGQDNSINRVADYAEQAGVVLDGGSFDMNTYDQNFDGGILTVTNPSKLHFGGGSVLTTENVNINSRSTLRIYRYTYPVSTDRFYSKYPGLATLRRITYPELNSAFGVSATEVIYGRWRGTSTSKQGEIVPRIPPTSTGFAYLTVTKSSRIFFEGSSRLSVQDIDVYEGSILEIRNWGSGDILTVELDNLTDAENVFSVNECLSRIKFYNDSGTLLNRGDAKLALVTVHRDRDNKDVTICKVLPH